MLRRMIYGPHHPRDLARSHQSRSWRGLALDRGLDGRQHALKVLRHDQRADRRQHALPLGEVLLEDEVNFVPPSSASKSRVKIAPLGNLPGPARNAHLPVGLAGSICASSITSEAASAVTRSTRA